jgi:hypothetical protein
MIAVTPPAPAPVVLVVQDPAVYRQQTATVLPGPADVGGLPHGGTLVRPAGLCTPSRAVLGSAG